MGDFFMSNGRMYKRTKDAYEIIPRSLLQHERLSLQAIGLLCNLQSYPADWELYKTELYKRFPKNKETSVRNAFDELVKEKYIVEIKERDGRRWLYTYYFQTEPFTEEEIKEFYEHHGLEYKKQGSAVNKEGKDLGTGLSSPQNEKVGTGFSRPQNGDPKMETSKPRRNILHKEHNTHKDITYKDNKHLSINNEAISHLDLPDSIKNILSMQIDRLIDYNFNLKDIEMNYKAYKNTLNEYQYAHMLAIAIKEIKEPIHSSAANFLQKSVETYRQYLVSPKVKGNKQTNASIKRDQLPKWLIEEKNKENNPSNQPSKPTPEKAEHEKVHKDYETTFDQMLAKLEGMKYT